MEKEVPDILPTEEFYAQVAAYKRSVDPSWDEARDEETVGEERKRLLAVLGPPAGRSVLDASCGTGNQALALASLGWNVTGADVTAAAIDIARRRAMKLGLDISLHTADMRALDSLFGPAFDCVISCMALDNITDDEGISRAVQAISKVLRPGGCCYIRLRNFDNLLAVKPRYDVKEERILAHGRVIRLEDWLFENETHVVNVYIFLHEDKRTPGYAWTSSIFAFRRRALRKAELARFLDLAGLAPVTFLAQPSPWHPYEVIASRAAKEQVLNADAPR